MKKILAIGASTSSKSINRQLANYAATQVADSSVNSLDLNDYEMPIYSVDREEQGIPPEAVLFKKQVAEADGIILSIAEHNGTYSAAFKNIFDWASRVEKSMWLDKPMILLSTSPGGRGGSTALDIAADRFPFMNAEVIGKLAVPSFFDNFSAGEGLTEPELKSKLMDLLKELEARMASK